MSPQVRIDELCGELSRQRESYQQLKEYYAKRLEEQHMLMETYR